MRNRPSALAEPAARAAHVGAALRGGSRRLLRAEPLVLGACALVICAFYFWTAYTSPSNTAGNGYYALLTDAFLDGQTHLPVEPAPELLALPDPYDPAQIGPYGITDLSLYQGHYYLYFGPTPVLLVHLPLRAVGITATDALASSLFASVGFLFALALMRFLVQRYRPETSLGTRVVAVLLLGLANVVPFLLRRPAVWEEAIAAGYCCLLIGLFLTLTGALRDRPSLGRLAGGSLALGLAVGARPHLILALPVFIWAWIVALRAVGRTRSSVTRLGVACLTPVVTCLVLLGVYNFVRFDSFTEFGSSYQLGAFNPQTMDRFAPGRLGPGAFSYLLAPPKLDLVFPFIHLDPAWTGVLPTDSIIEPVAGVIALAPVILLAFAAPVLLVARRRTGREAMTLASLLLLTGLLTVVAPTLTFNGATMRYAVDFATLFLLAALLVWLRLEDATSGRRLARWISRAVAGLAAAIALIAGLALSVTGYWDGLRVANPTTYQRLEAAFDWVPTAAAKVRGEPLLLEVRAPRQTPTSETVVRVATPSAGIVTIRADFVANPALPRGSIVALHVRGSDDVTRRVPLVVPDTAIRAGVDGAGVSDITIAWDVTRYAGVIPATGRPPGGFALLDARISDWSPS
jgi:hypothetical protein